MTTVYRFDDAVSRRRQPSGAGLHVSMELDSSGSSVYLRKHRSMQLRDAAGWSVKALAGTVWITQDGDSRDIVLEAGESFVVDRDGNTLLHSLDDARICIARKSAVRQPQAQSGFGLRLPSVRALFA